MSNDWMHGVLVNPQSSDAIKIIAKVLLGSQIIISSISLMYFQTNNNTSYTMFSMYTFLYSIMCLSNATKN